MMGFLGSSTAETLFGSRTGDVLTKSTEAIAAIFMITSLSLAYMSLKKTGSITKAIKPKPGLTLPAAESPIAPAEGKDALTQKGSELLEKAKGKLLEKIPKFGPRKKAEPKETPEAKTAPVETTKSNIRYDEKRNKIVDEYKYDSAGKLIGHKEITYDRFDKVIGEKALPLEEKPVGVETPETSSAKPQS